MHSSSLLLKSCFLVANLLVLMTLTGDKELTRCPYSWTQVGSRCFAYNQTPMSWDSAKRHCWGLGANLASVHTSWEHQRIIQLFGNTPVWIGGSKGPKLTSRNGFLA
uniref:C-type lectin domain-containing protein n=1 Tax=Neolamprologus brichardi TaxID=32507 RepID=A0A3Q4HAH5_NEOBR